MGVKKDTKTKAPVKASTNRHEKRDLAKILFVTSDMNLLEIEQRLGVTRKTLAQWRDQDNWEDERTVRNVSPVQIQKRLNAQLEKLLDELVIVEGVKEKKLDPATVDMISKLTKAITQLRNSITPQTVMEVLNGFAGYLSHVDLDTAQKIADYALAYVQVKMKEAKDK